MNMLSWDWEAKPGTRDLDFTQTKENKTADMREYNRIYREKHSNFIDCGCGSRFKEISKYTHIKSARHVRWATGRV